MTTRSALLRGAAVGVSLAAGLGAAAHAAPAKRRPPAAPSANQQLVEQLQALTAQVQSLQARLDAQEQAQAQNRTAAQAAVEQAQAAQVQVAAAQAELKSSQEQIAAAQTAIAAIPAPPATAAAWDGAPRFTGAGNTFKFRGRLLLDAVSQKIDRPGTAGDLGVSQVRGRQAFVGIEGTIGPNWAYKLEGGAVNGGAWAWDDAIFQYNYDRNTQVILGNQKGFGYENLTSSRFTSFIDRGPFDNVIDATYQLGVYFWKLGPNWSFNAGVTGHTINSPDVVPAAGSSNQHERITASTRFSYTPINNAHSNLHLAGWARYRKRGDDGAFSYSAGYFSPYRAVTLLSTGAVGDNDASFGVEGLYIRDSLSFQGEYAHVSVNRTGAPAAGPDFGVAAAYAFVSWFPTGEKRAYATTGNGRIRVLEPLTNRGLGAWELLARYDWIDLKDARTAGGVQLANAGTYNGFTLGTTWYPINYVRFMANYSHGKSDNLGVAADATTDVFQMRAQIDF